MLVELVLTRFKIVLIPVDLEKYDIHGLCQYASAKKSYLQAISYFSKTSVMAQFFSQIQEISLI